MSKSFFSHDSNAKDDPKIINLIDQLGLEGYGAFWVLIELLRDQPNYRLPLAAIPRISRTYNITQAKLTSVINCFSLFNVENEYFFSFSLLTRMKTMSEIYSKRTYKGWDTRKQVVDNQHKLNAEAMLSNAKNAKEKKRKENKVKEIIIQSPPSLIDVTNYFTEKGYTIQAANKFHAYYETANWHDSKNNKVKNWKQKAQGVWFKDENKQTEPQPQTPVKHIKELTAKYDNYYTPAKTGPNA